MKDIELINHPFTHELTVGDEPDRIDGNFRIYKFVSKYESITLKLEHVELTFKYIAVDDQRAWVYDADSQTLLGGLGPYRATLRTHVNGVHGNEPTTL